MARPLTKLVTRLRALDTFSFRVGLIVGVCMLVSVTVAAAIAYRNARTIIESKENLAMTTQVELLSERVRQAVGTAQLIGQALSTDDSVTSSLHDDEGVGRFLEPVLRLARASLARIFSTFSQIGETDVLLLDFMGNEVAPWKGNAVTSFAGEPWVDQVMKGLVQAVYLETTDELLLVYPVLFPATGQPEGALVVRFSIAGIPYYSRSHRWDVVVGPVSKTVALESSRLLRVMSRKLEMPAPFDKFDWAVAIGYRVDDLEQQARSILWSFLIAVLLSVPLIIAAAVMIGRQLARPLAYLAVDAMRISDPGQGSSFDRHSRARGTVEIKALAKALQDSRKRVTESTAAMRLSQEGLNAANEGIVIVDAALPRAPVVFVNNAFETLSGFSRDELVGAPYRILTSGPSDDPDVVRLHQAYESGERCDATVLSLRKNGEEFWDEIRLAPIRTTEGELTHLIMLHKDVTDRKNEQVHLQELQKLEAIGQLTGGLAHDFNNLLGVVVGNLDLLQESLDDDPKIRRQHRSALDAALRAAEVAHSLLAVARRQPLEISSHDVNQLLSEMLPLLRTSAGSAVRIETSLHPGALMARIDAAGMSNVVLNLVINARDAMKNVDHDRNLTLRTRRAHFGAANSLQLEAGDYVALEVADNGTGMDEATVTRAFEPFFTTKERGKGTGLGLAMVFGYARQLGGVATIDSVVGKGTVATVYLPALESKSGQSPSEDSLPEGFAHYNIGGVGSAARNAEAGTAGRSGEPPAKAHQTDSESTVIAMSQDSPSQSSQSQTTEMSSPDFKGRVLVVDDEEGLCELACLWIESLGYQVEGVNSPADALQLLKQEHFDILFTDVVMPGGMDGIELARQAMQLVPGIHVLLASGYAKALLDEQSPPGPLLNKPYRKPDLARAFDALVSGEQAPD